MSSQMNVGGALQSMMMGDPIAALHKLFDESPEENIREAAFDVRTGKCTPEQGIEKILKELEKGGDSEALAQVQQLVAELEAGGDPEAIFQAIHEIVDPKGADKLTRESSRSVASSRPGSSSIDF
jgi:hypothetical protein